MIGALQGLLAWIPLGLPAFLFVITVIVFFHELGHFSVARAFGIRVETFSIGFGREIIGRTDRHGTRWKIGWLPVGGYVKFFGDADAASRPDHEGNAAMTPAERAQALPFKPLYQRVLVVAAGPFANFILAIVIFTLTFMFLGRIAVPPIIGSVTPGSPAQVAGLMAGDVIRTIDGTTITDFGQLPEIISVSAGQDLAITLQRGNRELTVHATPKNTRRKDLFGTWETVPTLGVGSVPQAKPVIVHYGPVGAAGEAVKQTWSIVTGTLKAMEQIVLGRTDASQLRGPVGTAALTKSVAEVGILALVQLIALLSVSIGLINLFPIPVLDGGHLLYYGCEAVLGHPLGERAQEVGFRFGLALVLGLMIFSFWNDLTQHLNLF
jgi:regulator of sigma E protease